MKNHYVDVLPANRYLYIYLFYSFHLSGGSYKDLWGVPGLTNPSFHVYFGGFSFVEMEMEMENAPVNIVCAMNVLKL